MFLSTLAFADDPSTGLWVGNVIVDRVNRPGADSAPWNTTTNLPAANPFSFRVIIHVSTTGQARLVQRALLVYQANGAIVTNAITGQVTTSGTYRLLSDESQVPDVQKGDSQAKVTRVSSVGFPLTEPQILNGQFGIGNALNGTVTLPHDDPVNPFVHVYAPLHDNRHVQSGVITRLPPGDESFEIIRSLSFQFATQDPLRPTNPKWGVDENGGEFRETIEGLYRPIQVQGQFRLQRLTTIGRLETKVTAETP
jgi:hypothetical protein